MTHALAASGNNADSVAVETLFWILAVVSCGAALAMILVRHAVHCAMMLAVVMLCLATMYAMQGAPFLAFVQIIVYTGAVLMLFLFVLMLVGIDSADPRHRSRGDRAGRDGDGGEQYGQPDRDRDADLHHLRVPVRNHRRPADHLGGRRHGARAPRAHDAPADAARSGGPPDRQRAARPGPVARRLRAARRRGPAGSAAGRQYLRRVGQHGAGAA